jgi:hypothetical protein
MVHIGPPNYEGAPQTKKPSRRWGSYVISAIALLVFFATIWLLLVFHYSSCNEDADPDIAVSCDDLPVWSGALLVGGPFVLLGFGLIVMRGFRSPWARVGAAALGMLGFSTIGIFPYVLIGFGLVAIRGFRSSWPPVCAAALALLGFALALVLGGPYR